jgi:hypothetical protein
MLVDSEVGVGPPVGHIAGAVRAAAMVAQADTFQL